MLFDMATTPWRGCVAADRNGFLNIKIKVEGRWRYKSTGLKDSPENRVQAERALADVRDGLQARDAVMRGAPGPTTVRAWSKKWMETRREQVADASNDQSRLDHHVLPIIGGYLIAEVRPRHILDVVTRARTTLAPRTIRNIYSVMQALFREATIADLIESTPCLLASRHLGKNPRQAARLARRGGLLAAGVGQPDVGSAHPAGPARTLGPTRGRLPAGWRGRGAALGAPGPRLRAHGPAVRRHQLRQRQDQDRDRAVDARPPVASGPAGGVAALGVVGNLRAPAGARGPGGAGPSRAASEG